MSETYLTLAEGFEKLAAAYRALADCEVKADSVAGPNDEQKEDSQIPIEAVRAVLAEKSRNGKTREVKELLMKYAGGKLSDVKPEDYAALLTEAEVL